MEQIVSRMFAMVLAVTPWAGAAILILAGLRQLLKRRLSPRFFQLAFLVIALRLALPFDFSLPQAPVRVELPPAVEQMQQTEPDPLLPTVPVQQVTEPQHRPPVLPPEQPGTDWMRLAALVWMSGAVIVLCLNLGNYERFSLELVLNREKAEPEVIAMACRACGRPIRVYRVRGLAGPLLSGLLRPAIYLPMQSVSADSLPYVLAHEACHARRMDLPGQFVMLLARSLHWFDPLVHWMAELYRQDMERSCDESVLAGQDLAYRKAYGMALLESLSDGRRQRVMALSTGFSGGKEMKRRFEEMFDVTKKSHGLPLLALLTALVAVSSVLVACGAKPAPAAVPPAPSFVESTPESQPQEEDNSTLTEENTAESQPKEEDDSTLTEESDLEAVGGNVVLWPFDTDTDWTLLRRTSSTYKGVDLGAPKGTPILAAADGTVVTSQKHWSYGNYLIIHLESEIEIGCEVEVLYAGCDELKVQPGDQVKMGDVIATVGDTAQDDGDYLHLELIRNGEYIAPESIWTRLSAVPDEEDTAESQPNGPLEEMEGILEGDDIPTAQQEWIWPLPEGKDVNRAFAPTHFGNDIPAEKGAEILAASDGTVILSEYHYSYGNVILMETPDGLQQVYAHCDRLLVNAGDEVKQGQKIAEVGNTGNSTGNHLHFEVRKDGRRIDPEVYVKKPA